MGVSDADENDADILFNDSFCEVDNYKVSRSSAFSCLNLRQVIQACF
jgi:hypothetical protein